MYVFYALASFTTIVNRNYPIINIIYFNTFLFLIFYGTTVLASIHFIYSSLKYGNIYILGTKKVAIKNRIYENTSPKINKYCGGLTCIIYIDFYSNNKFVGRYFIQIFGLKVSKISEDVISRVLKRGSKFSKLVKSKKIV
jgi:hypothetical protein